MKILDSSDSNSLEGGASFNFGNKLFRAAWNTVWLMMASWTPAPLHRWRVLLLRFFGAEVEWTARIYGSARIWYPPNLIMHHHSVLGPRVNCYNQAMVTVGEKVVVSQGAHLCAGTHDISDLNFQLLTKPITLSCRSWVASEAFVGPGVTVGEGAVLGARTVLFRNAEPWGVYVGNPAQRIKTRVFRS